MAELLAPPGGLQVAVLGVTDGVEASVLVQSPGTVRFVVNVMGDFLQILEVGPGKEPNESTERAVIGGFFRDPPCF